MDENTVEQAKQVEKIYNEVVEEKFQLAAQEPIKIWLRPLKYPSEKARSMMAWQETKNLMEESGADKTDVSMAAYIALRLQTLFYSIRKGPEDKAPRFFETLRQAGSVPGDEMQRLFDVYESSFEMSEEELGNSLRAKTNS